MTAFSGRFGRGRLALALTVSTIWFLSIQPATDSDYGWHIENGRRVLDGTAFSGRDLYSWTASGYWIVHEWLTEAMMTLIHDAFGRSGNSFVIAVLVALAFALVALRLRRRKTGWLAIIVTVWLGFFGSLISAGVRPQVVELVYLSGLCLIIDTWMEKRVTDRVFFGIVAGGAVLWANTHGSFLLMPAILGLVTTGMLIDRSSRWKSAGVAAIVSAALAIVNPWGWRIYAFATQSVTSGPTLQLIEEWKRPQLLSTAVIPFDVMAALALIAAASMVMARLRKTVLAGPGVGSHDVAVALALGFLALTSGRHVMLFGIGAAPLIAHALDRLLAIVPPFWRSLADEDQDSSRGVWMIHRIAALAVAAALFIARLDVLNESAQQRAMASHYPVGLVEEIVRLNRPPARLLNDYDWGGFLIENHATPVFIDGRSEVYGDAQLIRYSSLIDLRPGWYATLDSLGVTLVLARRTSRLPEGLRAEGWNVVAEDNLALILRHPNARYP